MTDLTRGQIENIKLHYFGREGDQRADGLTISDVRKLCNMARRTVPEGCVVPREPTVEMVAAGKRQMPVEYKYWQEGRQLKSRILDDSEAINPATIYKAMLAAAPE